MFCTTYTTDPHFHVLKTRLFFSCATITTKIAGGSDHDLPIYLRAVGEGPAMNPNVRVTVPAGIGFISVAFAATLQPGGLSYLSLNLGILAICWAVVEFWDRWRS